MVKIGEFSKLGRVSVKTLRYYADIGLLRPAYVDRFSGYRYYGLEQLPRLNRILALKELGFSLVQIERLIREDLGQGEIQHLMRLKHAELAQQVQAEQARLERVAVRLRQIEQEGRLPQHEVLIKRLDGCRVAAIRDTVSGYAEIGELFAELYSYLGRSGVATPAPPMALYHDREYREQGVDVEVAVPVGDGRSPRSNTRIRVYVLPTVDRAASVVCTGDYAGLSPAYAAIMAWSQSHGYRSAGPNREVYLQGPGQGIEPSDYVTEIQVPVLIAAEVPALSKKGITMEPQIITKQAFTVVGLPFKGLLTSGPYEDGENNNEIGKVWDAVNARWGELKYASGPAIGLCFGMPNAEQPWYLAGAESSSGDDVPSGMMAITVPTQKYAVFECTLPTIGQTYGYITEQWQPASGYQRAEGPDFEVYDEKWDPRNPQTSPMYIYWPIK